MSPHPRQIQCKAYLRKQNIKAIGPVPKALLLSALLLGALHASAELGVDWTEATPAPPWAERSGHGSLVYDGKLWVMGGSHDPRQPVPSDTNDVWYSEDGVDWIEATPAAPWSGRRDFGTVVFDSKMWIIGGVSGILSPRPQGGVWHSEDGVDWTMSSDPAFLDLLQSVAVVAFNGQIWIIAGPSEGLTGSTVWYSSDGIDWALAVSNPPGSYGQPTAVAFDGSIWVVGHQSDPEVNEVWYSDDGVIWSELLSEVPWTPRRQFSLTVHDERMWLIGGLISDTSLGDVWHTTDGVEWTEATPAAPWTARSGHTGVSFLGDLWTIAGAGPYQERPTLNDIWFSGEGEGEGECEVPGCAASPNATGPTPHTGDLLLLTLLSAALLLPRRNTMRSVGATG